MFFGRITLRMLSSPKSWTPKECVSIRWAFHVGLFVLKWNGLCFQFSPLTAWGQGSLGATGRWAQKGWAGGKRSPWHGAWVTLSTGHVAGEAKWTPVIVATSGLFPKGGLFRRNHTFRPESSRSDSVTLSPCTWGLRRLSQVFLLFSPCHVMTRFFRP